MHPSTSLNADSPAAPTFKVTTRALTADLAAARSDESSRELGALDSDGLVALLGKLAALDPSEVAEADPHLVVTGRRGRFTIRPGRERFLLRSSTDAQNYLERAASEIPSFLDGKDISSPTPSDAPAPVVVRPPAETKLVLALTLFALAALIVATSAWLTFRPDEVDPGSDYVPVTAPAETITMRQQAIGTYASGTGDDERVLEITADGTARYREYGPGREPVDEHAGNYTLARRRADQVAVLRVSGLGTIELKGPDTLVFARDSYQRRPVSSPTSR